ncbi:MAG: tetratricopeptide repeat protein [Rhodocyclaceae bacterium]|nr:tetratricopeptide repeat protein [Rhodocyclaceae bacterium]
MMRKTGVAVVAALLLAGSLPRVAHAQMAGCGNPFAKSGFGPYDYRVARAEDLQVVERRHFTNDVATLRSGRSGSDIGPDIAYTLRVFPNHYRALQAMARLSLKVGANPPSGAELPVECWFERGVQFVPDDAMVRVLYGNYLSRRGQSTEAVAQYERARELAQNSANVHYNIGLAYFNRKDYKQALASAHKAYELGFPLPGLRDMLKRAGKWEEPAPAAEPQPESAATGR